MASTTLFIATNNPGKLLEFQSLLENLVCRAHGQLVIVSPANLSIDLEVAEMMPTYDGNATAKARAYHQAATAQMPQFHRLITLADDSGLEVEALGNAPGIFSRRYGSQPGEPPLDDAGRRAYLIEQLRGFPRPWRARFHCSLAVIHAGGLHMVHGACQGTIIPIERGTNGFGYDPIFLLPEMDKTMAELDMREKNTLSHRARAVLAALPTIEKMISD